MLHRSSQSGQFHVSWCMWYRNLHVVIHYVLYWKMSVLFHPSPEFWYCMPCPWLLVDVLEMLTCLCCVLQVAVETLALWECQAQMDSQETPGTQDPKVKQEVQVRRHEAWLCRQLPLLPCLRMGLDSTPWVSKVSSWSLFQVTKEAQAHQVRHIVRRMLSLLLGTPACPESMGSPENQDSRDGRERWGGQVTPGDLLTERRHFGTKPFVHKTVKLNIHSASLLLFSFCSRHTHTDKHNGVDISAELYIPFFV